MLKFCDSVSYLIQPWTWIRVHIAVLYLAWGWLEVSIKIELLPDYTFGYYSPTTLIGVHTAGLPGWLEFSVMIQLLPSYKHEYSGSTTLARGTHCWSAWQARVQCHDTATPQL